MPDEEGRAPVSVDIIGYRDWARTLHYYVKNALPAHEVRWNQNTIIRDADITFLVGWSEMIENPAFYQNRLVLVLHPSPLPLYRGGSPIQHQIIAGETVGAVSLFRLDEEHARLIDGGPIAWQQAISLEGTLAEILGRIAKIGAAGVVACVEAHAAGTLAFWEQPAGAVGDRLWERRTPSQSEIFHADLESWSARKLHDKVRALADPYPNAFIVAGDGKRLYITDTHLGKDE